MSPRIVEIAICLGLLAIVVFLDWQHKVSRTVVDRFTRALAFSAIAFAVFQFYDSGRIISDFKDVADNFKNVEGNFNNVEREMSTRSAGNFPKNMADINEVIAHTNNELDVMTDYVGYGHYSAPPQFETYLNTIHRLRDKPHPAVVRMLIYTRNQAERIEASQFTDTDFQKERTSDIFKDFCSKYSSDQPCPQNRAQFTALLFQRQEVYMRDLLKRGVQIRATCKDLPFYFWNADGDEAVFSFWNTGPSGTGEISFRTREQNIIKDAFMGRFNSIWDAPTTVTVKRSADPNQPGKMNWDENPCGNEAGAR